MASLFFIMAAVCHLEFSELANFSGRRQQGQEGQCASPYQISWRSVEPLLRCVDYSIFSKWRRSPSWICCACFDHTRRAYGGLYHCAKFGWNRCSRFDNMQVLIFCKLGLKTLIHAPKCRFGGIWLSKWGAVSSQPHKALPCTKTRHMTFGRQNWSIDAGWMQTEEQSKVKKKGILRNWNMWQITCSPRLPLSQRHMDLHVWPYPDVVIYSRFHRSGVLEPRGGSKFGHAHYFSYSLLRLLVVLPYKPRFFYVKPLKN